MGIESLFSNTDTNEPEVLKPISERFPPIKPSIDTNQDQINELNGGKCDTQGYTMGVEYTRLLKKCQKEYEEQTRNIDGTPWVINDNHIDTILQAYEKSEGDEFNYLKFLKKYRLPESVKNVVYQFMIIEHNIIPSKENSKIIHMHLENFIKFFIDMEGDGYNNRVSGSGARGFFQYLSNNGGVRKDREWGTSSIQTALKKVFKYPYTAPYRDLFPKDFLDQEGDIVALQDASQLSAAAQTILFICDIMGRKTKQGESILQEEFLKALTLGDHASIEKIYEVYHSQVDEQKNTRDRLKEKIHKYFSKDLFAEGTR